MKVFEEVMMILELHSEGLTVSAIAARVGMDRKTVRKYIAGGVAVPTYSPRKRRPRAIDGHIDYLLARLGPWPELTAQRLHRELAERGYAADAARMEALARQQKGFISFRRYAASDGEALSISEWETEADARAWACDVEHAVVQGRARSAYYESYVVYSCVDPEIRSFRHQATI